MDKVYKAMQEETEKFVETPYVSQQPKPNVRNITGAELVDEVDTSAYLSAKAAKETAKDVEATPPKTLTDDDLNYLDNADEGVPQNPKPADEVAEIRDAHKASRKQMEDTSEQNMDTLVNETANDPKFKRGKTSVVVDTATAGIAKSMTQTMLEAPGKVANFIGNKILELPEGLGGKVVREASASLQQHSLKTRYLSQTQPSYFKLVDQFAVENGKRGVGRMMAQQADGQHNTLVKQFSDDVTRTIEQRRQGRIVTTESDSVLKMVDEIEKSMTNIFDDLVDAGVTGFRKDRRIKNYFPQLWDTGGIRGARSKYGRDRVQSLLAKGYIQSKHNKINSMAEALHIADNFLKDIDKGVDVMPDGAMPTTMDARAKTRLDIDTTVTDGELSLMDLLDNDLSTVTAKYANRASGQIALANKGIRSEMDVDALRKQNRLEGGDEQLFDDAMNLVMGRPTRDGLDPALNEVKDAIALSKMGGLGMAQAAEAGAVMARTLMQLWDDPKVFKKVWAMAGESTDNKQLMRETQALSGISNDVHLLDRQSTHLDRNDMMEISRLRSMTNFIAGKASFGKYKAPASYILAQGSGFNMIRRFERRIANASFMLDTAKTFRGGKGVITHARLRDLGLDPDNEALKRIFKDVVEYDDDGIVKTLNLDKWDKKTREMYHLAMYRDDAQMVQQGFGGENSRHLNRPAMTILAQFKQSALLANKKQLTRSAQFADKEAVLGTMLNISMAALTRTAKFGTLGAAAYAVTGREQELQKPWEREYWQPEKYVAQFGFFPDMGHIAYDSFKAYDEDRLTMDRAGAETVVNGVAGEIPIMGWAKDYYDIGTADSLQEKADAVKGIAILGNMQFSDILYKGLETQLKD
jgi:hypothetical protein